MTEVFISYSRKDKAFAGRLTDCLQKCKLETWIDWEDIPPTADWKEQIRRGIERSDAFLVLLSPESAASKACREEVEHALQNGKRLIPIVVRKVRSSEVHPALAKVNWIDACESAGFDSAVNKTLAAVRTDLAWAESHRRLQVRALEWEKRKDRSLLLRGKDLHEAEEQLASAGHKDPQPTDLQRRYILESHRGESRTRNLLLVISAVVIAALAIASFIAVRQSNYATNQAEKAVAESNMRSTAEVYAIAEANTRGTAEAKAVAEANTRATAQAEAEEAQAKAEKARIEAENERNTALSNGLSNSALVLLGKKEISLAFLLAVQANKFAETARSRDALYTMIKQNEYMLSALPVPDTVAETFPSFRTNATGDLLVAEIDNMTESRDAHYVLWDLNSYQLLDDKIFPVDSPISIDENTHRLLPNDTGQPLYKLTNDEIAVLENYSMIQGFLGPLSNEVRDAFLLPDSRTAVVSHCKFVKQSFDYCAQPSVYVLDIKDKPFFAPQEIAASGTKLDFLEIAYNQNDQLFALADAGGGIMQVWQEQDGNFFPIATFSAPGFVSIWESRGIELIPDRQLVAWGTGDQKIILFDFSLGAVTQEYPPFDFSFNDFEISPDGTFLAIHAESGTKVFLLDQEPQPVESGIDSSIAGAMGFDGLSRILAVGSGTQIWVFDTSDTSTWHQKTKIKITSTGDTAINNLFVNKDGTTIAVGMLPFAAGPIEKSYLIDIKTGLETVPFDETMSPTLSPDNDQLAAVGYCPGECIKVWNLDIKKWVARACQIANRNLTQAEWDQYIGDQPYQLTCLNLPAPN